MAFQEVLMRIWRVMLCGGTVERKRSLELGSPTDVRRMDISETMPGLSPDDKRMIREKASNDAYRLLSLQSHPPTQPPSPGSTSLPPSLPASGQPSREPSQTLLNAASSNMPPSIPTPVRRKNSDASPPAFRMKGMWERTRRLSSSMGSHHSSSGYQELDAINTGKGGENSMLMLNLDLDLKDKSIDLESPISVTGSKQSGDGKSIEGEFEGDFEKQSTVGGTLTKKRELLYRNPTIENTVENVEAVESSDSDGEHGVEVEERKRLVKT